MTVHTVGRAHTGAGPGRPPTASAAVISRALLVTIVLVSWIAPLATDMCVPAFPRVGDDLLAGATQVQLTLTTFFVGMALGQLVGGPVSDARGRRSPLLLSLAVLTLASVACAVSPSIQLMMVARFVQGLAGAGPWSRRGLWSSTWPKGPGTVATLAAARLAGRVATRTVIATGLLATGFAGALLLAGALWWSMPLPVTVIGFLVLMSAQGLVGPNADALASQAVPEHPGTGSALLGFSSGAPQASSPRWAGSVVSTPRCRWQERSSS